MLEIGASKSFVPQSDKYEQPNLALQFKHKVASRFEYSVIFVSNNIGPQNTMI